MRNLRRPVVLLTSALAGIAPGFAVAATAAETSAPSAAGPRSGIVIRGSGNNVSVEREEVSSRRPALRFGRESAPVLLEAVRMKEAGSCDDALVGYLRAHAAEIPSFVDYEELSRLQSAGAGRAVVAYLASVAAVEIGPTGAVGGWAEEPAAAAPEPAMSNELPAALGYGVVIGGGGGRGFRRRAFGRVAPFGLVPPGTLPMHPRAVPPAARPSGARFFRR